MLQYDNSAFYFFALSTISFYILPCKFPFYPFERLFRSSSHMFALLSLAAWYSILKRIISAIRVDDEAVGAVSRTSAEKEKAEQLKKESRAANTLKSQGFLVNLGITSVLTLIFIWLLISVSQDGQVNSFDPFSILQIDAGADNKTIKKAYRSLSLKYHPDKNPGDRAAEAMFMMVSKAYEALTDETARENWEKYGNPDGKQSLEVSIGLPSFLLDSKNRNLVLVAYLLFMVVLIPYFVWRYYSDSSKYGEKNVMYDTYSWFHHALNENSIVKALPEVLAGSAEFRKRNIPKTAEQKQAIATLMNAVRGSMQKPKFNHPVCVKGNVLMHAHLLRQTDVLAKMEQEKDDLKYMLRMAPSLIDAMISVCKHQDALQTAINCIELGQYVTQAMWVKDSPLLQIPHFTAEEVSQCEKGNIKASTIKEYCAIPENERKGLAKFSDQQKKDVRDFLKIFPDITVECKVFVDDDEDDQVYENDLVTVQVKITRNNLADGEKAGLTHAPKFPFPKREAFWIILGQLKEGKIISIEKVLNPNKNVVHQIKFMAPPKGTYHFDLVVKSDGYVGIDETHRVEMVTLDSSSLPEYKVHPDDAVLDDEPTLFEEMLNAHIEKDSDDEDEDSDDEDDDQPKSAAAKKKEQLRKARQGADDDDDSDSDAEEVYADK
jgi:translocation protein SEC63